MTADAVSEAVGLVFVHQDGTLVLSFDVALPGGLGAGTYDVPFTIAGGTNSSIEVEVYASAVVLTAEGNPDNFNGSASISFSGNLTPAY